MIPRNVGVDTVLSESAGSIIVHVLSIDAPLCFNTRISATAVGENLLFIGPERLSLTIIFSSASLKLINSHFSSVANDKSV